MKKEAWILIAVLVVVIFLPALYIYTRPKGFIKIETDGAEMRFGGGWFASKLITSEQGAVPIRQGAYRPVWATITIREGDRLSSIRSYGPWGKLSRIEVKGSETTVVRLGPPFDIKTDVITRGKNISIGLEVLGVQSESWRTLTFSSAGRTANPGLKIVDENGSVLTSGKFEYG